MRIVGDLRRRLGAHAGRPVGAVLDDGRQQPAPLFVRQDFARAGTPGGDQRVRCAQIDTDRQPSLVRIGRHAWFGYLE